MSVSAPANKHATRTASPVKRVVVLLGDDDGSNPTTENEVEYLRPLKISRMAGARSLVTAIFEYDLTKTGERLVDLRTPSKWKRIIEIRQVDDTDEAKASVLFWGELAAQDITIDDKGEKAIVRAAINRYHFGDGSNGGILTGAVVRDPNSGDEVTLQADNIAFNPVVDGKPRPNRSQHTHSEDEYHLWVDVESVRTESAQNLSNDEREPVAWTLRRALDTIQRAINPDETWIENDLEPGALDESIALKSIELPVGASLPEYLDRLLVPFGFSWYITFGLDEGDGEIDGEEEPPPPQSTRSIKIFKTAEGPKKKLLFQRPGESYDPAKSNTPILTVSTDVGRLVNEIICQGGVEEREVTIELRRGWSEDEDDLGVDDLRRSDKESQFATSPNAWRLWVANEAGDWTDTRDPAYSVPDFSTIFSTYVPKRRPIDDCLTLDAQKVRRKPLVECYIDEAWTQAPPEWGYTVLTDQLGIRFTGDTPPEALVSMGEDARIRITGTIKGDVRIESARNNLDGSPLGRTARMVVDVSDRFFDRKRIEYGKDADPTFPLVDGTSFDFYSTFSKRREETDDGFEEFPGDRASEGTLVDSADDTDDIQDYADKLVEVEGAADLTVSATTFGIATEFEIGDLIEKVEGREISFNRQSVDSGDERFPQVIGIVHDLENQSTELILASNDGVIL